MKPRFNVALMLTWFRIAAIPLVIVVFMLPGYWYKPAAALLFTLAGLTDWLDGYLARKLNLTSRFGAFLDPVADKLMVSTALVLILELYRLVLDYEERSLYSASISEKLDFPVYNVPND